MSTIFWNRNISNEAHLKMGEFTSGGHEVIWVAFPPPGGNHWSIVTDKTFFNRSIPEECHQKMIEFSGAGHKILCVAFPPQGGNSWSIITDKGFFNRNIPDECHQKMTEFSGSGHKLHCVAFPPQGGNSWSIITDKGFFNRNIPDECHQKMTEFSGAGYKLLSVAFPLQGGNSWSIVADKAFFNRNIPEECHRIMSELQEGHGPLRVVAFDGDSNGWSVVSNKKAAVVYRLPFDNDPSWKLANGNWDDPIAGHGKGNANGAQAYSYDFVHDSNQDGIGEAGQHIRAARSGTVAFAIGSLSVNTWGLKPGDPGYGARGEGNLVVIRHTDGIASAYAHLKQNQVFVKQGDSVSCGQIIALSGNVGNSSTPHLHFDVHPSFTDWDHWTNTMPIHFEDKNHIYWRPKVGDTLASNNS